MGCMRCTWGGIKSTWGEMQCTWGERLGWLGKCKLDYVNISSHTVRIRCVPLQCPLLLQVCTHRHCCIKVVQILLENNGSIVTEAE